MRRPYLRDISTERDSPMNGNLYELPVPAADAFATYCGGNAGGSNETCVSLAAIPGEGLLRHPRQQARGRGQGAALHRSRARRLRRRVGQDEGPDALT